MNKHHLATQKGGTLIENMVAVLLISFASLGLIGLQTKAIAISNDSHDRNLVAILADDAVSMMQLNKSFKLTNDQKTAWEQALTDSNIPNIKGVIKEDAATESSAITITWKVPQTSESYELKTKFILAKDPV